MRLMFQLLYRAISEQKLVFTLYCGAALVLSVLGPGGLWVTKGIANSISVVVQHRLSIMMTLKTLGVYLMIQVGLDTVQYFSQQISTRYCSKILGASLTVSYIRQLLEGFWRLGPGRIETNDMYNEFTSLQSTIHQYSAQLLPSLFSSLTSLLSVTVYTIILVHVSLPAGLFVLIMALPTAYISIRFARSDVQVFHDVSIDNRSASHLMYQLSSPAAIRDMFIHKYGGFLLDKWSRRFIRVISTEVALKKRQIRISGAFQFISYVANGAAILIVLSLSNRHALSIGADLAIIQAMGALESDLVNFLNSVAQVYSCYTQTKILEDICEMSNTYVELPSALSDCHSGSIEISQASYRYHGRQSHALSDLNLSIECGKSTVIVGRNGSGKSTLLKCMMGLYPLSEGIITFGGVPVSTAIATGGHISAVFQDFVIYPISIIDNITIGNISVVPDVHTVSSLLESIGLSDLVDKLPCGLDTILDSTLGTTLSGGELQKIAICRALYSNPQVLVLDEPTASLDPIAERDIYRRVLGVMRDKTVIFVSHRMAVCPLVDTVVVLKGGSVVDMGDHEALLDRCHEYQDLYAMQIGPAAVYS